MNDVFFGYFKDKLSIGRTPEFVDISFIYTHTEREVNGGFLQGRWKPWVIGTFVLGQKNYYNGNTKSMKEKLGFNDLA